MLMLLALFLTEEGEIEVGTSCKNKGCDAVSSNYIANQLLWMIGLCSQTHYGADVELTTCRYHPGFPIFHEG